MLWGFANGSDMFFAFKELLVQEGNEPYTPVSRIQDRKCSIK